MLLQAREIRPSVANVQGGRMGMTGYRTGGAQRPLPMTSSLYTGAGRNRASGDCPVAAVGDERVHNLTEK